MSDRPVDMRAIPAGRAHDDIAEAEMAAFFSLSSHRASKGGPDGREDAFVLSLRGDANDVRFDVVQSQSGFGCDFLKWFAWLRIPMDPAVCDEVHGAQFGVAKAVDVEKGMEVHAPREPDRYCSIVLRSDAPKTEYADHGKKYGEVRGTAKRHPEVKGTIVEASPACHSSGPIMRTCRIVLW